MPGKIKRPQGGLNACLIDSGIDPRAEEVWRHVVVINDEQPSLTSFWGGDHGAETAAQLIAGQQDMTLTLLQVTDLDFFGPTAAIYERWSRAISDSGARVVNMSVALARVLGDCEAFMGRLMQDHPDVLFVAAVGNSGALEPINACPAGLVGRHPNLITVAGTTQNGTKLHRDSNHGRRTAMVAAPYSVTMKDPLHAGQIIERHGTSYAAPAISNAALRCLAKAPEATPTQIVARLMEACVDEGLEVACGGAVDVEAFLTGCAS